jgi:hypothetical protein
VGSIEACDGDAMGRESKTRRVVILYEYLYAEVPVRDIYPTS